MGTHVTILEALLVGVISLIGWLIITGLIENNKKK